MEERFARATGMTILGDRARLELGGRSVALAHGDFVYNRNPKYSAYRALMREHHPDRLTAEGMPKEMIELATRETQAINAAYDRISRERGFR